MHDATQALVLQQLLSVGDAAGIPVWLCGGYGLDALEGRCTRPHGDIDVFVHRDDHARFREALCAAGFELITDGAYYSTFQRLGQWVECRTHETLPDGTPVTDTGGTGVYPWPGNTFPEEPTAQLLGRPVRVISYEAQYVFKAGFQAWDPTEAPREKDLQDLELLCRRVPPTTRAALASLFDPLPGTRTRFPGQGP